MKSHMKIINENDSDKDKYKALIEAKILSIPRPLTVSYTHYKDYLRHESQHSSTCLMMSHKINILAHRINTKTKH